RALDTAEPPRNSDPAADRPHHGLRRAAAVLPGGPDRRPRGRVTLVRRRRDAAVRTVVSSAAPGCGPCAGDLDALRPGTTGAGRAAGGRLSAAGAGAGPAAQLGIPGPDRPGRHASRATELAAREAAARGAQRPATNPSSHDPSQPGPCPDGGGPRARSAVGVPLHDPR